MGRLTRGSTYAPHISAVVYVWDGRDAPATRVEAICRAIQHSHLYILAVHTYIHTYITEGLTDTHTYILTYKR